MNLEPGNSQSELDCIQHEKDRLRGEISPLLPGLREPGKVAQVLRSYPPYRRAKRLFVSPAPELLQIRINCLVDGKELVMPGPALKDGFYGFQPYSVNFTDLVHAVSLKGVKKFGKPLDIFREWSVDLFLTEGLALGSDGCILGDGNGFFDLSFAILARSCPENAGKGVGLVCNEEQILSRSIPRAPWDVDADFYISADGLSEINPEKGQAPREREAGPIFWHQLTEQRIKKVSPLWKIWKNRS